jgi:hypothetical protein
METNKVDIKNKITNFLENGISSWTGKRNVRYPEDGNIVFLEILENFKEQLNYKNIDTFFECGTHNGNNANDFSNVFNKVITVEINNNLYDEALEKYKDNNKISFILGDATTELEKYIKQNPKKRMVILLDDHSEYNSYILKELETIKNNSEVDHIIVIDDIDKLGQGTYPTKEQIFNLIKEMNKNYIIMSHNYKFIIYVVEQNITKEENK